MRRKRKHNTLKIDINSKEPIRVDIGSLSKVMETLVDKLPSVDLDVAMKVV